MLESLFYQQCKHYLSSRLSKVQLQDYLKLMNREYIRKIRKVLTQTQITVPYIFEQFYTILKKATIGLDNQQLSHLILQQYSNIFKIIKKYFQDESFSLLGKTRLQMRKQLQNLLKPFMDFLPIDFISQQIVIHFRNQSLIQQIEKLKQQSQQIMKECSEKNNKVKIYGNQQLANIFWVVKFKHDYAVHFDIFWKSFLQFCQKSPYYSHFISNSSKKFVRKIVDPDKKYYVTSTNLNQLFVQLSQPQCLQVLHDITSKNQKVNSFVSYDLLVMKFHLNQNSHIQCQLIDNEEISVCGQNVQTTKIKKLCKYPPTIRFGSAADSDIQLKSKFVSRKQFMLIEEEASVQKINFSLVCLSPSNFTLISFKTKYKLKPGCIFKIGNSSYQVLRIYNFLEVEQKINSQSTQQQLQQDQTLEYLPDKVAQQSTTEKQLEYIQLVGENKGVKGRINYKSLQISNSDNNLKLIYEQKQFWLPSQSLIYAKNANQVINGQLSDKIRVEEGMKIILEECYFQIED